MTLIDARSLPDGRQIQGDLCIIGAGAAGLAIADILRGARLKVVLLESGAMEPEAETQALCQAMITGRAHAPLHTSRLRYFGGTTNHWTGFVRPLEVLDFQSRPWVAHSGWPFGIDELQPFYERAAGLLGLTRRPFAVDSWANADAPVLPFEGDQVQTELYQIVSPGMRRLGPRLKRGLEASRDVEVYLFANVLEIEPDESLSEVRRLRAGTLSGKRFSVRARYYVLATGGIENARILLLSSRFSPVGLGNAHGLVGRFYANHPEVRYFGHFLPTRETLSPRLYLPTLHAKGITRAYLKLADGIQQRDRLLNCRMNLNPLLRSGDGKRHGWLAQFDRWARRPHSPIHSADVSKAVAALEGQVPDAAEGGRRRGDPVWPLSAIAEQAPNPESRVLLGPGRDRFGQQRVRLEWRLGSQDSESIVGTAAAIGRAVGASGLGRFRRLVPEVGFAEIDARGSHHHMGTTRMNDDPKHGVVDRNCRVHGLANLFVAGSSVFPTYGTANPTLTILALAYRLADHLKSRREYPVTATSSAPAA